MWPVSSLQSSKMLYKKSYSDLEEYRPPWRIELNTYQPIQGTVKQGTSAFTDLQQAAS